MGQFYYRLILRHLMQSNYLTRTLIQIIYNRKLIQALDSPEHAALLPIEGVFLVRCLINYTILTVHYWCADMSMGICHQSNN